MKKSLLMCGAVLLSALAHESKAQLALENFDANGGALPANWALISDGRTVSSSFTGVAAIRTALNANAWTSYQVVGAGNYSMITTSLFTPSGQADRWLITPAFTVTSANTIFKWEDYDLSSGERLQVMISPTGDPGKASFNATPVYDAPASPGGLTAHAISLAAYNSQTIRLAFRDNMTNNWGLIVDNVSTAILANTTDASISGVTPDANEPTAYGTVGKTVNFSGTIKNEGVSTITTYVIKYQVGTGAIQSHTVTGKNIGPLGTDVFTHSVAFSIPATGNHPVKVWVELPGDALATNDTANTMVFGVSRMPAKKLVVEEGTGTWCGWCTRGIVYMDSLQVLHPNSVSLIAVHNNDPMEVAAYDNWMGTQIGGYPSVVVDRRVVADPSEIIDIYDEQNGYFAFADVTLGAPTKTATTYDQPVTIRPAINLSGDYRLVMVLIEDKVTGTTSGYDQVNYYSFQSQNIALSGGGVDYRAAPARIPAADMHYNFVARDISPTPTGANGVLPATMTAETDYTVTLSGNLNSAWNNPNMRAIVMLVNNTNGYVLNSNNREVALGVSNAQIGLEGFRVFPNPARELAQVSYNLKQSSSVQLQVVDALGRTVFSESRNQTAGAHVSSINLSSLAAGVYNVIIRTDNGSLTERLSVVK